METKPNVEEKVDPTIFRQPKTLSVFDVFSKEQLQHTIVVLSDKNPASKNQVMRVTPLLPWQQNLGASVEAKSKLTNLRELTKTGLEYPKMDFEFPPMQVLCKREKMAGIGKPYQDTKTGDMSQYKHSFWFVATTNGLSDEWCARFGGREQLEAKQLEAIRLFHEMERVLQRKQFDHPMNQTEEFKKERLAFYKQMNPDITLEKAMDFEFRNKISDHKILKIAANLQNTSGGKFGIGIAAKSNAWYRPSKPVPTKEQNESLATEYLAMAGPNKYVPDMRHHAAILQGLRHRRVPIFGKKGPKTFVLIPPPIDPTKIPVKAGDYVIPEFNYHMYINTSGTGGSVTLNKLKVVYQCPTEFSKSIEAGEECEDIDDYENPYEEYESVDKRHLDDSSERTSKRCKTESSE